MPATKSLPVGENAFLRGLVQKVLDQAATQTEAAQRLGVSQSYLNEFVGGTRGAGPKLLKGLAKLYPKLSGRLLGLAESDESSVRPSSDPRTPDERAVDEEFMREFDRDARDVLVEAVQYAAQRGPRFFRQTWWRMLNEDRKALQSGSGLDPIALGERLLGRARVADDDARRKRSSVPHGAADDEDDRRPTLPAPSRKPPPRKGTRKDTPAAKKGR